MAATYTFLDAWNIARKQVPSTAEFDHGAAICNIALNEIWNAYDWRVSIAELPPFVLIPQEQDHGAPAVSIPTDFSGLREAWIVAINSEPAYRYELQVMKDLRLTHNEQMPHAISYEPSKNAFRLFPRIPTTLTSPYYLVDGIYKKHPTKITATTLASAVIPWDDTYFSTVVEAVKWAGLMSVSSPAAGGVQTLPNSRSQFTGQYAVMKERIFRMAQTESVDLGNPMIAPRTPFPRGRLGGSTPLSVFYYY